MSNVPSPPTILCVYASPRNRGNSDLLLDAFAEGARAGGAEVEAIRLRELKMSGCREIYACRKGGACALRDDMEPLYAKLLAADGFALATPVMFYGVSALGKAFIDRTQALWARKYLLKLPVNGSRVPRREGALLCVAGSKGAKVFDGVRMTFRYFLDVLDAEPGEEVLVREVDEKDDILAHPEALEGAREAGGRMARKLVSALAAPGGAR